MRRLSLALVGTSALVLPLALPVVSASGHVSGQATARGGSARSAPVHWAAKGSTYAHNVRCPGAPTCTEEGTNSGQYVGHEEPATLFYSKHAGSGNAVSTTLQLPKDPKRAPDKGGTPNAELHVAFWWGMAMCDDQSAPNPGGSPGHPFVACKRDSDKNIYTSTDPKSGHWLGRHPGTAFMEMQFYPPGWVDWPAGDSCDGTHWCAALNIDSVNENENTGQQNNSDCQNAVGPEPVNFAFITKNGVATGPANPLDATATTYTPDKNLDLFMKSGDKVRLQMQDTPQGFRVVLHDLTAHTSGSMTASVANGFGAVNFQPNSPVCTVTPTAFHPEYASSTTRTRVPWASHSYNIAYSDEIGHFERCRHGAVTQNAGDCLASPDDPDSSDVDDTYCFKASASSRYTINGCYGEDDDFDGASYQKVWPGSTHNKKVMAQRAAQPLRFTSEMYKGGHGWSNYDQVAFESNIPRTEQLTTPPCQRHVKHPKDPHPGQGCVGMPAGAAFYPTFSTIGQGKACYWVEGGTYLPHLANTFGGLVRTEFGNRLHHMLTLDYPATGRKVQLIDEDYRRILSGNPCPTHR